MIGSLLGGIVKVALTPVAVAKDCINVVSGKDADATKQLIKGAMDDFDDMIP